MITDRAIADPQIVEAAWSRIRKNRSGKDEEWQRFGWINDAQQASLMAPGFSSIFPQQQAVIPGAALGIGVRLGCD